MNEGVGLGGEVARVTPALRNGWAALRETLLALSEQIHGGRGIQRAVVTDHLERVRETLVAIDEIEAISLRPPVAARGSWRESITDPLPFAYGSHAQVVDTLLATSIDEMSDFELTIRARALVRVLLAALDKRERWLDAT